MPTEFNWYTDEEDLPEAPPDGQPGPLRQRSRLKVLLAVAVVVLVVGLIYQQIIRRSEAIGTVAQDDVLATAELVQLAAVESDVDLMTTFLSGRNPDWSEAQKQLVGGGLLYDLSQLGFFDGAEQIRTDDIALSPDLKEAEVSTSHFYHIAVGRGITETVALERTTVYRRGEDRWLLAPPDSEFWGETRTTTGEYLSLNFPERDREVAERLGVFLEAKLNEMCNSLTGLGCPDDLHVVVTLDPNPYSQLLLADSRSMLQSAMNVNLPSPSLVGIPADEVGYQALFRGYAAQVISAVITELVGWKCCDRGLFFLALLDKQLEQLALRLWPLTASEYEDVLAVLPDVPRFRTLWRAETADAFYVAGWHEVYAGLDYLLSLGSEVTAVQMQKEISSEQEFAAWLNQYIPGDRGTTGLGNGWLNWLQDKSLSAQISSKITLPEQDIQTLCRSRLNESEVMLYRFDPSSQIWESEGSLENYVAMMPLSDDSGVVLQGRNSEGSVTAIWRNAQSQLVYGPETGHLPGLFFTGLTDESGQQLLMFELRESEGNAPEQRESFYWLDGEDCGHSDCGLEVLPGRPLPSPNGVNTIYLSDNAFLFNEKSAILLEKGEDEGVLEVGEGAWVFWLDDDNYGFLRQRSEIMQASVHDEFPLVLISVEDLLAQIPGEKRPGVVTIDGALADGADGGKVVILATSRARGRRTAYYYLYDIVKENLTLILTLNNVNSGMPRFSPDGRWAMFQTGDRVAAESSDQWSLYLFDIEQQRLKAILADYNRQLAGLDWSSDSRWLVRSYEGFLELIAPEYDVGDGRPFHQLIVHDLTGCDFAAWVNK